MSVPENPVPAPRLPRPTPGATGPSTRAGVDLDHLIADEIGWWVESATGTAWTPPLPLVPPVLDACRTLPVDADPATVDLALRDALAGVVAAAPLRCAATGLAARVWVRFRAATTRTVLTG